MPPRHEGIVMGKLVTDDSEGFKKLEAQTLLVEPTNAEGEKVIWGAHWSQLGKAGSLSVYVTPHLWKLCWQQVRV